MQFATQEKMNTKKISIAIVDDHQVVIDGLKSMLQGLDRFTVVAETNEPLQMLEILKHQSADILLTDIMMPLMNGAQLAIEVHRLYPGIRILALSMSGQGELVNQMIEDADIAGYILKNIGKNEFIHALEKISTGGIYFSEEVLHEMIKASELKKENIAVNLTAREVQIVKLIEKEYSNKTIANSLFLSERTVETHRKNIFRKTKTSSVLGLIKYAHEHNLV